tara:strand:+ start:4553 stop:4807 length:255 start_codon:yes stop_codon:yes gene_type:complete
MNTSIISENISAVSLLALTDTYNNIDISKVLNITGTDREVVNIIDAKEFVGFNAENLWIINSSDSNLVQYMQQNTTSNVIVQEI